MPFLVLCTILYFGYFSSNPLVPENPVRWSWERALREFGYTNAFVQQSICGLNAVEKPDPYNQKDLEQMLSSYKKESKASHNTPDIILILNESYYDLDLLVETDVPKQALDELKADPNFVYGYATSPKIGGGTNKSEYELLTSNSLKLIPVATPFASVDLVDANSVVNHLDSLGYTTLGTHPYFKTNYNRDSAYPKLGFDVIKWQEDYDDQVFYGEREGFLTDACVYSNMTRWYETMTKAHLCLCIA